MKLTALCEPNLLAMLLEALMLVCFGVAWPLARLRMLRTGQAEGKSMAFTAILSGYIAGARAELAGAASAHTLPLVFWLYMLYRVSVGANLLPQRRLGSRSARR